MHKQRIALAAAGLGLMLSGCAGPGTTANQPAKPAPPFTAKFVGPKGPLAVTAEQFANAKDGWLAVAQTSLRTGNPIPGTASLLATTDGGRKWTVVAKGQGTILGLSFLNAMQGFVLESGQGGLEFLSTADGGQTLSAISQPPGKSQDATMRFTSAQVGILVAGATLDVTADGGRTWTATQMEIPAASPNGPGTVLPPNFLTPSQGYLSLNGGIYETTDSGRQWQQVYTLPTSLNGIGGDAAAGPVYFATPKLGYAALNIPNCWAGGCPDVIVRTTDGGARWTPVSGEMQGTLPGLGAPMTGPPGGIGQMVAWGAKTVAVADMQGVSLSQDGGVTWQGANYAAGSGGYEPPPSLLSYTPGAGLLAAGNCLCLMQMAPQQGWRQDWPAPLPTAQVQFVTKNIGFALQLAPIPVVLETTDGGRTWHPTRQPPAQAPSLLAFANRRQGWVTSVGQVPEILATADAGLHWKAIDYAYPRSVQLFSDGQGLALTQPSDFSAPLRLYGTRNGGKTFTALRLPGSFPQGGVVSFATPSVGFAGGTLSAPNNGELRLYGTVDGGQTWVAINLPTQLPVNALNQLTADPQGDLWMQVTLRVSGSPRQMLYVRLPDGQWQTIRLSNVIFLYGPQSLSAVSAKDAWMLTSIGLYRTTDGGRTWKNLAWPLAK